ncbi:MAG: hypothetical protein GY768_11955 [Planctomycetaceae bacterium]|nr:hypothetical protein [Planctomycetaceae bacterium]
MGDDKFISSNFNKNARMVQSSHQLAKSSTTLKSAAGPSILTVTLLPIIEGLQRKDSSWGAPALFIRAKRGSHPLQTAVTVEKNQNRNLSTEASCTLFAGGT